MACSPTTKAKGLFQSGPKKGKLKPNHKFTKGGRIVKCTPKKGK